MEERRIAYDRRVLAEEGSVNEDASVSGAEVVVVAVAVGGALVRAATSTGAGLKGMMNWSSKEKFKEVKESYGGANTRVDVAGAGEASGVLNGGAGDVGELALGSAGVAVGRLALVAVGAGLGKNLMTCQIKRGRRGEWGRKGWGQEPRRDERKR